MGLSSDSCMVLIHISELGCWALSETFMFQSDSVRSQGGYLTGG